MPDRFLNIPVSRKVLQLLARWKILDQKALDRGYEVSGIYPDKNQWHSFLTGKLLKKLAVATMVLGKC